MVAKPGCRAAADARAESKKEVCGEREEDGPEDEKGVVVLRRSLFE
jgi:hypothetical protein